jgi:hypothetical protein
LTLDFKIKTIDVKNICMKRLHFTVEIDAPKEKVWENLWSDSGYRKWTSAFAEGSYAESDWEQGSTILFLSPKGEGMFAEIEEKIPYEKMTFRHLGEIKNGVEELAEWDSAIESYTLQEKNGKTTVVVEVDAVEEFENYLTETFPKALRILKRISEQ